MDLLVYMIYDISDINTPTLSGSSVVWCSTGNGWEQRESILMKNVTLLNMITKILELINEFGTQACSAGRTGRIMRI